MLSDTPKAIGTKFDAGGNPLRFPGLSVVAMVPQDAPQCGALLEVQERTRRTGISAKLTQLPRESFHMTLFDLVCDQVRVPDHWSSELSLDAPLEDVVRFMAERVGKLGNPPADLRMRFVEVGALGVSLHLVLEAEDERTARALTSFRDNISVATGVRHPNHESYRFHVTLAYRLAALSKGEQTELAALCDELNPRLRARFGTLHLPSAHLTFFPDMWSFPAVRGA